MTHVVYLTYYDFTLQIFVAFVQLRAVVLLNAAHQVLTEGQDEATTKLDQLNFFRNLFTHFVIWLDFQGSAELNFHILVFYLTVFYYCTVAPNL